MEVGNMRRTTNHSNAERGALTTGGVTLNRLVWCPCDELCDMTELGLNLMVQAEGTA